MISYKNNKVSGNEMKKLILLIWTIFTAAARLHGEDIGTVSERAFEDYTRDNNSPGQVEIISYYREHKLNLAVCDAEELALLPGFDDAAAEEIIEFVTDAHPPGIRAVIDSLGLEHSMEILLEYCTIIDYSGMKKAGLTVKNRTAVDFNKSEGISSGYYKGSGLESHSFARFSSGAINCGANIGKSPGEIAFTDFAGGYLAFGSSGWKAIVGNYTLLAGGGALFGSEFLARKGADPAAPASAFKNAAAGTASETEGSFLSGAVIARKWYFSHKSSFSLRLFGSSKKMSGKTDSTGLVTSISRDGLYRSESETAGRNSIDERLAGLSAEYRIGSFRYGAAAYYINYDKKLATGSAREFTGKGGVLSSCFVTIGDRQNCLGTELALDARGNGSISVMASKAWDSVAVVCQLRAFHQDFRSPYGAMFGEQSNPSNELGVYLSYMKKTGNNGYYSLYADFFKSFIRTYYCPEPIRGIDVFAEAGRQAGEKLYITARMKTESKLDAVAVSSSKRIVATVTKSSVRINLNKSTDNGFNLNFRVEGVYIDCGKAANSSSGISAMADVAYSAPKMLRVGARCAVFSTDDYDSAVWQFEYVAPGYVTTTALQGSGSRLVVYSDFDLGPVDILARYNLMSRNGVKSLGSGRDATPGNTASGLLLSVQYSLNY